MIIVLIISIIFCIAFIITSFYFYKQNKKNTNLFIKHENLINKLESEKKEFEFIINSFIDFPNALAICSEINKKKIVVKYLNIKAKNLLSFLSVEDKDEDYSFKKLLSELISQSGKKCISEILDQNGYYETDLKLHNFFFSVIISKLQGNEYIVYVKDITSIKQSLNKLQHSQLKYKSALWLLGESALLLDGDNVKEINAKAQEYFKSYDKEIIGKSVGNLIGFSEWEKIKAKLTKKNVFRDNIIINLNGKKYFELIASQLDDNFKHVLILLKDLTKEKEQIEVINRLNLFKEKILHAMPSFILVINKENLILEINHKEIGTKKIKSKSDIFGKHIWGFFPELIEIKPFVDKLRKNNEQVLNKKICITTNSHKSIMNLSLFPVNEIKNQLIIIRLDDITKEHNIKEHLVQAQKMEMIGQLAGGLVHDFNNILGSISGVNSLLDFELKEDKITPESIGKKINIINISLSRAGELVNRLLVLGRKIETKKKLVDVKDLINESIEIVKASIPKNIKLEFSAPPFPIYVYADYMHIQQVIINLIQNAKDALAKKGDNIKIILQNDAGGELFENTVDKKNWIKISVKDNGSGISKDVQDKIFMPFFTTKPKGKGTGLGLAMAYNLIKEQGGEIKLASEENLGTTFTIFLPKLNDEKILDVLPEEEKIYSGSGRILVVDDDEVIRMVSSNILIRCGYEVSLASDGKIAMEILKKTQLGFDLVILDLVMPNKNGYETFLEMQKEGYNIPVVVATGFKDDLLAQEIGRLGAKIIIQKPFSIGELSKVVYEVLHS